MLNFLNFFRRRFGYSYCLTQKNKVIKFSSKCRFVKDFWTNCNRDMIFQSWLLLVIFAHFYLIVSLASLILLHVFNRISIFVYLTTWFTINKYPFRLLENNFSFWYDVVVWERIGKYVLQFLFLGYFAHLFLTGFLWHLQILTLSKFPCFLF